MGFLQAAANESRTLKDEGGDSPVERLERTSRFPVSNARQLEVGRLDDNFTGWLGKDGHPRVT